MHTYRRAQYRPFASSACGSTNMCKPLNSVCTSPNAQYQGYYWFEMFISRNLSACDINLYTDPATRAYIGVYTHNFLKPTVWYDSRGFNLSQAKCADPAQVLNALGDYASYLSVPSIIDSDKFQFNSNSYRGPYYLNIWGFKVMQTVDTNGNKITAGCPIDTAVDGVQINKIHWTVGLSSGDIDVPTSFSSGLNLLPFPQDLVLAIQKELARVLPSQLGDVPPSQLPFTLPSLKLTFTIPDLSFIDGGNLGPPIDFRIPTISYNVGAIARYWNVLANQYPTSLVMPSSDTDEYYDVLNGLPPGEGQRFQYCNLGSTLYGSGVPSGICGLVANCVDPIGGNIMAACPARCFGKINAGQCDPNTLAIPISLGGTTSCTKDSDCGQGLQCCHNSILGNYCSAQCR